LTNIKKYDIIPLPTEIGVLDVPAEIEFIDSEPVKPDTDNAVVGNFSNARYTYANVSVGVFYILGG